MEAEEHIRILAEFGVVAQLREQVFRWSSNGRPLKLHGHTVYLNRNIHSGAGVYYTMGQPGHERSPELWEDVSSMIRRDRNDVNIRPRPGVERAAIEELVAACQ